MTTAAQTAAFSPVRTHSLRAALIFTSGYVDRMPGSLLDSGRVLSVHIYDLAMNVPGGEASAHGTALVLVLALLVVELGAIVALRRIVGMGTHE